MHPIKEAMLFLLTEHARGVDPRRTQKAQKLISEIEAIPDLPVSPPLPPEKPQAHDRSPEGAKEAAE